MQKCYVYQLCYKQDIDNVDKGYIGITTRSPSKRKEEHFADLILGKHHNYKVQNAFNENGQDFHFKVLKKFNTVEDALRLEASLRPKKNVAWNIAVGGKTRNESKDKAKRYKAKEFATLDTDIVKIEDLLKDITFNETKPSFFIRAVRLLFFPIRRRYKIASAALIIKLMMDDNYFFDNTDTRKYSNMIVAQVWDKKTDIFKGLFGNEPHRITTALYCLSEYTVKNTLESDQKFSLIPLCGALINQIATNSKLYGFNNVDMYLTEQGIYNYMTVIDELHRTYPVVFSEIGQFTKSL